MVQHHHRPHTIIMHHHIIRKGGGGGGATEHGATNVYVFLTTKITTTKPKLFCLFFFFFISSCLLIFHLHLFRSSSTSLLIHSSKLSSESQSTIPNCSYSSIAPSICCDRTNLRSDICYMEGDVRTEPDSFSISVYASRQYSSRNMTSSLHILLHHENIKPYTRKWETSVMNTIDELHLIVKNEMFKADAEHRCDVWHDVPAVIFSTGGYTGNVYHEFNDGLLPLYITSQHFNRNVVFMILEYHDWWISKYDDVLSLLSRYPPIDFNRDKRRHCFPRAIIGLKIHGELAIEPSLMIGNKSIQDFRHLLDEAYSPTISDFKNNLNTHLIKKPKLVIVSRKGSRAILNEKSLIKMAVKIGFEVKVLKPSHTMELSKVYRALNSSDVMIGVHGAAMTHFLFMRPGSTFIQVIPVGTDWAAEAYYGEPAKKLGLNYFGYKILAKESSLYSQYDADDPVLKDPESVNGKGWELTKRIYLDGQNVILNLERFQRHLIDAHEYVISNRIRNPM